MLQQLHQQARPCRNESSLSAQLKQDFEKPSAHRWPHNTTSPGSPSLYQQGTRPAAKARAHCQLSTDPYLLLGAAGEGQRAAAAQAGPGGAAAVPREVAGQGGGPQAPARGSGRPAPVSHRHGSSMCICCRGLKMPRGIHTQAWLQPVHVSNLLQLERLWTPSASPTQACLLGLSMFQLCCRRLETPGSSPSQARHHSVHVSPLLYEAVDAQRQPQTGGAPSCVPFSIGVPPHIRVPACGWLLAPSSQGGLGWLLVCQECA